MPLVPREKIDDVRERTNIVDIIKRYVELKRAGTGSWKGLCPFHAEKTPSFHVHEARQFFHCFGCGEKGDVFGFLVKIEQRAFTEVLRDLAQQAGVELPEREPLSPAERRARVDAESERDRLMRVMDLAAGFFEQSYAGPAGAAARAYVEGRGIGAETRKRFRIGYAPARWDALQDYLMQQKVAPADGERLGLVGTGERGRYDFFRDRVMLPVFDRQKRVIGFGSRLLDPEAKDRKYVNSPDSPLFHKKECLYGLHVAIDAVRKSGTAVVVEGNFDVLALHEAGVEEAVAPMGTALTTEQVALLERLARRVVVVFDGDSAGKRASEKAVPLFVEADVDGRIARLPGGEDPDDFVRKNGLEAFQKLVEGARPMLDQFIQDAAKETSVPGRVAALDTVAQLLVKVRNPTTRELYARQLAVVLGLTNQQVGRALREAQERGQRTEREADRRRELTGPADPGSTSDISGGGAASRPGAGATALPAVPVAERPLPRDELELLALIATYPELCGTPDAARAGELLVDPGARQLFSGAREAIAETGRLDVPAWLDAGPADVRRSLSLAMMDAGLSRADNPASKLRALSCRLELQRVEAEISMTARLMEQARNRGDATATQAMMVRGIELDKTKQGLKSALQRP
ncbi:MAG: DNA primase [Polyangia bacterium]